MATEPGALRAVLLAKLAPAGAGGGNDGQEGGDGLGAGRLPRRLRSPAMSARIEYCERSDAISRLNEAFALLSFTFSGMVRVRG